MFSMSVFWMDRHEKGPPFLTGLRCAATEGASYISTPRLDASLVLRVNARMPPKPPKAAPKPKPTKGEAERRREIEHQTAAASSEDEPDDDTQIRFQEAYGARLFRQGKPRALLEVKSSTIPTAVYEARLRGYDRASSKEPTSKLRKKG
jgi:hypothetical protein